MYTPNLHTHISKLKHSIVNIDTTPINNPTYYFSIGIHPWNIRKQDSINSILQVEKMTKHSNCIAIGECGLDRSIDTDIELQKEVFIQQVELANNINKPIIIHCVKAYSDFFEILKTGINKTPWIFHGYNSNLSIATKLTSFGAYLSFGKQLLLNEKLQEVFKEIPIDRIFLETDTAPIEIVDIYNKASEIRQVDINTLKEKIALNFQKIFVSIL